MSLLKRFSSYLGGHWWSNVLGRVSRKKVGRGLLARFLTSSRHFSRQSGRVNATAFMPPPDLRLSVFEIGGLSEPEIWLLGFNHVAKPPERNVHGRADLQRTAVLQVGLSINADGIPKGHASIGGWPAQKAEQKLFALKLADRATLRLQEP